MARSGGVVIALSTLMATMWGCGIDEKPCLVLKEDGTCAERWPIHPPGPSEPGATKPLGDPKLSMHDIGRRKARVARGLGATLGDHVYFAGDDGVHGIELLRTDGERIELVNDITSGSIDTRFEGLLSANGLLYFVTVSETGRALWRSDGTEGGTRVLHNLGPSSPMSSMRFAVGTSRVYFSDGSSPVVMSTDGTKVDVFHAPPKTAASVQSLVVLGDTVFLETSDGVTAQVVRTDGATSTVLRTYRDMRAGSPTAFTEQHLVVAGSAVYFIAGTIENGAELWKTDGTIAGTTLVAPGPLSSLRPAFETDLVPVEGQVFYYARANGSPDTELWVTDGTSAGTKSIRKTSYASRLVATTKAVYFTVPEGEEGADGSGLVMTNGAVTFKVASDVSNVFGTAKDKIFFSAAADRIGIEPWVSDGTIEGTRSLGDLRKGTAPSDAIGIGVAKAGYVLAANDDVGDDQLWATDGTVAGTKPIANASASTIGSSPSGIAVLPSGAALFFANDGETGTRVWFSDGTEKGTRPITAASTVVPGFSAFSYVSSNVAVAGSQAWFVAKADGRPSLYRTNGSPTGTSSFFMPAPSSVARVTAVKSAIYVADEMEQLHWFDGSGVMPLPARAAPGGVLVNDGQRALATSTGSGVFAIVDGKVDSILGEPVEVTGALPLGTQTIFTATRRDAAPSGQIYVTEGARDTTTSLFKGSTTSFGSSGVLGVIGSAAIVEANGTLYTTNGLREGTAAFFSNVGLHPRTSSRYEPYGVSLEGTVYFSASVDGKTGIYRTNGTKEGTGAVALFEPPIGEGPPSDLVVFRKRVWFTAYGRDGGRELYSTDGTADGTRRERDIAEGARSSNPSFLTVANDTMWFAADDYKHGRELFRLK